MTIPNNVQRLRDSLTRSDACVAMLEAKLSRLGNIAVNMKHHPFRENKRERKDKPHH